MTHIVGVIDGWRMAPISDKLGLSGRYVVSKKLLNVYDLDLFGVHSINYSFISFYNLIVIVLTCCCMCFVYVAYWVNLISILL